MAAAATKADAQGFRGCYGRYDSHFGGRGAAIGLGIAGAALATGAACNYYHRPDGYDYGDGSGYEHRYGYGEYDY